MWDHVVSNTPNWLYNSGSGNQGALHEVYDSADGYEPNNLQVGGFYSEESITPALLSEDGVTEGYLERDNMTGIDILGIKLGRKDLNAILSFDLYNNTDSEYVIQDEIVDTYYANQSTIHESDEKFIIWLNLDREKEYKVTVKHTGEHDTNAVSDYNFEFFGFVDIVEIEGQYEATLKITDDRFSGYEESFVLIEGKTSIEKVVPMVADGVDTDFVLTLDEHRASEPIEFGVMASGGVYPDNVTWYDVDDFTALTWGSDAEYDDNVVDTDGHFGVRFATAPAAGTVYVKYVPASSKAQIINKLIQPKDGDFIDDTVPVRLLDYAVEFI
jgi:hypothetical protein